MSFPQSHLVAQSFQTACCLSHHRKLLIIGRVKHIKYPDSIIKYGQKERRSSCILTVKHKHRASY